ncbi:sigma-54 interaction domain-containing protein [Peptacetobacter sp.]|uniref:sigma-54 interaction domain-containing protein n=1 Tax=Peptacetobacter sp. TaxID=2991975 RepID=UPI002626DB99|nr:sigma 54-interacting transcriptional regulator [Peptacetobacter sp.]
MKFELSYIKEDIQNIADAIETVLKIDVTIVDENLIRIAGTGKYINKIGEEIRGFAFKKSLIDKEYIVIDNPKESFICKECYKIGNCNEYGEICCPIICDEKAYGVIGLIAFSEEQREIIEKNSEGMVNFLTRMADLLSGKLKAAIKSYELDIEKKKLETLVDGMDKAVVSIDIDGKIDRYNLKFKKMFNINKDISGENMFEIFKSIKVPSQHKKGHSFSSSFNYNNGEKNLRGIYNMNIIELNGEVKGYVIDFTDKKEAIKNYNKMNKDRSIMIENIIGESDVIKKVKKETIMASKSVSTVLITGESGTGKELFARAIHNHSKRSEYPFIAVNCAAIPDNLLESELFGYEEGAFTGAKKGGKLGMFEIAHKGSLFLDEIGDMSLHLQSKLLRVLQEKEVNKIGAKSNVEVDVRIIAATNKDLEEMVKEGTFREDLYYRLNVIPIKLPNLSQRKGDISLLIDYMIQEYSMKLEKNVEGIDDFALEIMKKYKWPGNVRELQNSIEYSINMAQDKIITVDVLPKSILEFKEEKEEESISGIETLEELEKREIRKALKTYSIYKKDKDLAAKALGISRATLYRKIEKYKIK